MRIFHTRVLFDAPAPYVQSNKQSIRDCLCSIATSRLIVCIRNVQMIMFGYDLLKLSTEGRVVPVGIAVKLSVRKLESWDYSVVKVA